MSKEEIKKEIVSIKRIYIKDISFEAPNTPKVFNDNWNPNINLNLNTTSKKMDSNFFEIILQIRVIVKTQKYLVFLCDVHQAGIFYIQNFNKESLQYFLKSYGPNILFPYARECVSNLVFHASFPQVNIEPINFDAIYYKNIEFEKNNKQ